MIQKIGGRKFLVALVSIGIGLALELSRNSGLSPTFAAFLLSVIGTFSVANYASTKNFLASKKQGGQASGDVEAKVDQIQQFLTESNDPQYLSQIVDLLGQLKSGIDQANASSVEMKAMLVKLAQVIAQRRGE